MRELTVSDAKVLLQIRVPLKLRNDLIKRVAKENTSMTELINRLIEGYLA